MPLFRRPRLIALVFLTALSVASAQDYPNKPVRILVPFPAGGAVDIIARQMTVDLANSLGQSVVVDNRPGASGNIAMGAAAKAAPDGYTLVMASASLAINKSLIKSTPFDPRKDFTPVALVAMVPSLLVVNPGFGATSVTDLVARAKANPGAVNYGSNGVGTTQHLAASAFALRTGAQITHVPYKGVDQLVPDLLSGRIQMSFNNVASMQGQLKAGTLKALAIGRATRWSDMPDTPTYAEAGIGGLEYSSWVGLFGPAGMPQAVVDKLSKAVAVALANPETRAKIQASGNEVAGGSPAELSAFLAEEISKWSKTIAAAGLQPE
ncbi:MAG: tripartite tricarboxylate transporter substrate binding protein [Betaproteobacteria bacterium]|nr:tripartite tricarboxylate transporter substrate binding protein [Betaproteobacteria bacterium]